MATAVPSRRSRGPAVAAIVLVVLVAAVAVLPALVPSLNPFGDDGTPDRAPAVLESLVDLNEYHAASATLTVMVSQEDDGGILPSFLKGSKTTLLAAGSVDARVDFSGLSGSAVRVVGEDEVVVTLPAPTLTPAKLDVARSRVVDSERGVIDRVSDAVGGGDAASTNELYALAQRRLREEAARDPEILRRAEANTRNMLTGMLRALGFERVTVRFRAGT